MTDKIDDGGPAFPTDGRLQHGSAYDGMSLRDWFAGQSLAAELCDINSNPIMTPREAAALCYRMADMMLEARKKGGGQ